jgi:hypothetical protein
MTTWKELLESAFKITGDSLDEVVCTLSKDELQIEFDDSHGMPEGKPFTAWSRNYVYFPACYDSKEWIDWVSRNPDNKPTEHIGGW